MSGRPPAEDPRQVLGRWGEERAETWLREAGLRILDRRVRSRRGEVDLVALDGDVIVFVEVKARSGAGFGWPGEAVTARKRLRLASAARHYLARRGWLDRRCRFDVVELVPDRTGCWRVLHRPDAFRLWHTGEPVRLTTLGSCDIVPRPLRE